MSQAGLININSSDLPPYVATSFITSPASGTAVPANGVITFVDGAGIVFIASGSSVTASVITDGFPWADEAMSFAASAQYGYFCTGTLTCTLPVTGSLVNGSTVIIYVDTASVVTIQANTGQYLQISNKTSVSGGIATSNSVGATLTLVFRVADSTWHSISVESTWSVT